jgi:hypothetical protein
MVTRRIKKRALYRGSHPTDDFRTKALKEKTFGVKESADKPDRPVKDSRYIKTFKKFNVGTPHGWKESREVRHSNLPAPRYYFIDDKGYFNQNGSEFPPVKSLGTIGLYIPYIKVTTLKISLPPKFPIPYSDEVMDWITKSGASYEIIDGPDGQMLISYTGVKQLLLELMMGLNVIRKTEVHMALHNVHEVGIEKSAKLLDIINKILDEEYAKSSEKLKQLKEEGKIKDNPRRFTNIEPDSTYKDYYGDYRHRDRKKRKIVVKPKRKICKCKK